MQQSTFLEATRVYTELLEATKKFDLLNERQKDIAKRPMDTEWYCYAGSDAARITLDVEIIQEAIQNKKEHLQARIDELTKKFLEL